MKKKIKLIYPFSSDADSLDLLQLLHIQQKKKQKKFINNRHINKSAYIHFNLFRKPNQKSC